MLLVLFGAMLAAQDVDPKRTALERAVREDFEQRHQLREHTYLAELGTRLHASQVKLVESDEVVGAVLPGGWIYLSRGAVARAQTEAELAGMIAHLAAHRESAPILVEPGGLCSRFAPHGPRWVEREQKADQAAVAVLHEAGFDPSAWAPLKAEPAEGVVTRSEFDRQRAALVRREVRRPRPSLYR